MIKNLWTILVPLLPVLWTFPAMLKKFFVWIICIFVLMYANQRIYITLRTDSPPPPPLSSGGSTLPTSLRLLCYTDGQVVQYIYCRLSGERLGDYFPRKTKGGGGAVCSKSDIYSLMLTASQVWELSAVQNYKMAKLFLTWTKEKQLLLKGFLYF